MGHAGRTGGLTALKRRPAPLRPGRRTWGRAGFSGGSRVKRKGVRSPADPTPKEKERGASKP